jgi:glucose/arabinose dehydrogenase
MVRFLVLFLATALAPIPTAFAQPALTGTAAFGDWHGDAPGVWRHITPDALPAPFASGSASRSPEVIAQPRNVVPSVPAGFTVSLFASGLDTPRTLRTAPNGDVFLAESGAGAIRVFTGQQSRVFASNLTLPYGIGFWPPGPAPRFVYVAETNRIVRFPYPKGGPPEVIVASLADGGAHWTRDLVFSPDGSRMFVSIGSATNAMTNVDPAVEQGRAVVLSFTPDGQDRRVYASGLRNCSGEAVEPLTGKLWCAVNERDGLGDDLPPDFATSVRDGGFYGWPWFYIGGSCGPAACGTRQAAAVIVVPDVLIQPHSAPLGIARSTTMAAHSRPEYRGDAFVALHGSWNRSTADRRIQGDPVALRQRPADSANMRTFSQGFVRSDRAVWGRPVGVTVAADGALLVSEDGNGTIWRVAYTGGSNR